MNINSAGALRIRIARAICSEHPTHAMLQLSSFTRCLRQQHMATFGIASHPASHPSNRGIRKSNVRQNVNSSTLFSSSLVLQPLTAHTHHHLPLPILSNPINQNGLTALRAYGSSSQSPHEGKTSLASKAAALSYEALKFLVIRVPVAIAKSVYYVLKQLCTNPMIVKEWYKQFKDGAIHMWNWTTTGTKLFYANLRVSYQLLRKKLMGHPLRLREHKLLVRTTTDALKLIPFSLLLLIPFTEFALPVVIRVFPGILPSTFFQKQYDNVHLERKLEAKKELANFFQELIHERTRQILERTPETSIRKKAEFFEEFQAKLLQKDETDMDPFLSLQDMLKLAKLFKDEFVMEKMSLKTLQVMCRLLGLQPYGLHSHVVLQLRHHLIHIQREDRDILWEGVDNLTHEELLEACKDRGMRFFGISDEAMKEQMRQWLEFSSHKDIPPTLLLWARCITMTHTLMKLKEHSEEEETVIEDVSDKERAAAELEEANKRVFELKREENELKSAILKLQKEKDRQTGAAVSATGGSSKAESDELVGYSAAVMNLRDTEQLHVQKEKELFDSEVEKAKVARETLMRHTQRLSKELTLLRSISNLQHEQLQVAAKLFTAISERGITSADEKDESLWYKLMLETFHMGMKEIEELLLNARNEMHDGSFKEDRIFYPSDQSDSDDISNRINLTPALRSEATSEHRNELSVGKPDSLSANVSQANAEATLR